MKDHQVSKIQEGFQRRLRHMKRRKGIYRWNYRTLGIFKAAQASLKLQSRWQNWDCILTADRELKEVNVDVTDPLIWSIWICRLPHLFAKFSQAVKIRRFFPAEVVHDERGTLLNCCSFVCCAIRKYFSLFLFFSTPLGYLSRRFAMVLLPMLHRKVPRSCTKMDTVGTLSSKFLCVERRGR
jgi:hypothetical protein